MLSRKSAVWISKQKPDSYNTFDCQAVSFGRDGSAALPGRVR